jgi:hypothetical protein
LDEDDVAITVIVAPQSDFAQRTTTLSSDVQ